MTFRDAIILCSGRRHRWWRKVRKQHLKDNPECSVCFTRKKLEVHHIIPFDVNPEKELDPDNLSTLCHRHHFTIGHLGKWWLWNRMFKELRNHYRNCLTVARDMR